MSEIKQTIKIVDKASDALKKISNSVNKTSSELSKLAKTSSMMNELNKSFKAFSSSRTSSNLAKLSTRINKLYDSISILGKVDIKNTKDKFNELADIFGIKQTSLYDRFTNKTSGVLGKTLKIATAWLSIRTAANLFKKSLDVSNELTLLEARLKNIGLSFNEIYESSRRSRSDLFTTANFISRIGFNTGDLFKNKDELIKFSETIQKQFRLSGSTNIEAQNASIQLSQALGHGTLQGQEFASISRNAKLILTSIAKYLNVPQGSLKKLAAQGKLTSEIIKNSILSSADEIEKKFRETPKTISEAMTLIKNELISGFKPVSEEIMKIINSDRFNKFTRSIGTLVKPGFVLLKNIAAGAADAFDWCAQNLDKVVVTAVPLISILSGFVNFFTGNYIGVLMSGITLLASGFGMLKGHIEDTNKKAKNGFSRTVAYILDTAEVAINSLIKICNQFLVGFNVVKSQTLKFIGFAKKAIAFKDAFSDPTEENFKKIDTAGKSEFDESKKIIQKLNKDAGKFEDTSLFIPQVDLSKFKNEMVESLNKWTEPNSNSEDNRGKSNGFSNIFTNIGNGLSNIGNGVGDVGKNTGRTAKNTASIDKNISDMNESLNILKELSMRTIFARSTPININVQMTNNQTFPESFSPTGVAKQTNDELMRIMSQELNQIRAISGIEVGF